jgi:hypothetical protein
MKRRDQNRNGNKLDDEEIKQSALELIETEEDPKYRKKYSSVWRR